MKAMNRREALAEAKRTGKRVKVKAEPVTEVKVSINLRVDSEVLNGMKEMGKDLGIPYQTLINSALMQYVKHGKLMNDLQGEALKKILIDELELHVDAVIEKKLAAKKEMAG